MELSNDYSRTLYSLYVKSVIKNYPKVTFCSEVKDSKGKPKYLKVIQNNKTYKFEYNNIYPYNSINDLKELENRMMLELEGEEIKYESEGN